MFKASNMKKLIGVTIFIALLGGTFMVPAASARSGGLLGIGGPEQAVTVPTLEYPKGTVHIDNLMYLWVAVSSATEYQIQARDSSWTTILNDYYDSTYCSAGTCLAQPGDILSDDDYTWRMRAYVSGTWRNWSSWQAFTVETGTGTGFYSNFNSNHSGWSILKGTWSHESGAYFTTMGVLGKAASIAHSNNYSTLTYEVRMKRSGYSNSCANALLIRGDADQDSWGWWDHSYTFNYINYHGYYGGPAYAVTKDNNGTYYNLTDPYNSAVLWKSTSRVNSGGWNTLKVTASGSHLKFYINGYLIWSGTNSSYSSGRVGVALYRNPSGSCDNRLYLDWAELDPTVPDLDTAVMLEEGQIPLVGGNRNMGP